MRKFVCLHVYIYIYVQHVVCIFRYLQEHILHAGENRQYDLDMNVELSQTPICMFWSSRGAGGVHFFFETKHVETRRTHTQYRKIIQQTWHGYQLGYYSGTSLPTNMLLIILITSITVIFWPISKCSYCTVLCHTTADWWYCTITNLLPSGYWTLLWKITMSNRWVIITHLWVFHGFHSYVKLPEANNNAISQ